MDLSHPERGKRAKTAAADDKRQCEAATAGVGCSLKKTGGGGVLGGVGTGGLDGAWC